MGKLCLLESKFKCTFATEGEQKTRLAGWRGVRTAQHPGIAMSLRPGLGLRGLALPPPLTGGSSDWWEM